MLFIFVILLCFSAHLSGLDKINEESCIMGKVKECEKSMFSPPFLFSSITFLLFTHTNDGLSFSSGLSLNLIAVICSNTAAAVAVIYFCCRSSNKGKYHQQITGSHFILSGLNYYVLTCKLIILYNALIVYIHMLLHCT